MLPPAQRRPLPPGGAFPPQAAARIRVARRHQDRPSLRRPALGPRPCRASCSPWRDRGKSRLRKGAPQRRAASRGRIRREDLRIDHTESHDAAAEAQRLLDGRPRRGGERRVWRLRDERHRPRACPRGIQERCHRPRRRRADSLRLRAHSRRRGERGFLPCRGGPHRFVSPRRRSASRPSRYGRFRRRRLASSRLGPQAVAGDDGGREVYLWD